MTEFNVKLEVTISAKCWKDRDIHTFKTHYFCVCFKYHISFLFKCTEGKTKYQTTIIWSFKWYTRPVHNKKDLL